MSSPTYLRKVAPTAKTFHLVTQNVDRLSVQALDALTARLSGVSTMEAPKKRVVFPNSILEMHGKIYDVKCTQCDYCEEDLSDPLCPALVAADASFKDYQDAGSKEINIPVEELPHCPKCNSLARPGVVWFDEKPYHLDEINTIVYKADMCLVIGTSSTVRVSIYLWTTFSADRVLFEKVRPASTYAYRVQRHGGKVAVFNLDPSEKDEKADFVFRGPCEVILPQLLPELSP